MNFRTTIVLVVIAGLVLGFYFIDRSRSKKEKEAEEIRLMLFDVEQTAIRDIEIETKDGDRFEFEMRSGDWYITGPIDARADQGAVSSIVRNLTGSKIDRVVEEEAVDEAVVGLPGEIPQHRLAVGVVLACCLQLIQHPELLAVRRGMLLEFVVRQPPPQPRLANPGIADKHDLGGGVMY